MVETSSKISSRADKPLAFSRGDSLASFFDAAGIIGMCLEDLRSLNRLLLFDEVT